MKMKEMTYISDQAETRFVDTSAGRIAYRTFGADHGVPVLLFQRFRGTIDHWDPAFLEVLASERPVIVFDNAGVGYSTGEARTTMAGMAETAAIFADAIGLTQVDALGWSIGGFSAQHFALLRPDLVRRLLVLGSGPGGHNGAPGPEDRVPAVMTRAVNDDEDYLYLFFGLSDEARKAGLASLRRLDTRLSQSKLDLTPETMHAQLQAIAAWGNDEGSAWVRLDELTLPMLIANGSHDVMVHAQHSFAMSQRLAHATTVFYSDAGHGFLFQHPQEFGQVVLDFLR
jgi:pimeloyl-ACP methyl ester carboxylesterase